MWDSRQRRAGCSHPLEDLARRALSLSREPFRIDAAKLTRLFHDLACDQYRADVAGGGLKYDAAERFVHRTHRERTDARNNNVGLLSRGDRADLRVEATRLGAVDSRPFKSIADPISTRRLHR